MENVSLIEVLLWIIGIYLSGVIANLVLIFIENKMGVFSKMYFNMGKYHNEKYFKVDAVNINSVLFSWVLTVLYLFAWLWTALNYIVFKMSNSKKFKTLFGID